MNEQQFESLSKLINYDFDLFKEACYTMISNCSIDDIVDIVKEGLIRAELKHERNTPYYCVSVEYGPFKLYFSLRTRARGGAVVTIDLDIHRLYGKTIGVHTDSWMIKNTERDLTFEIKCRIKDITE